MFDGYTDEELVGEGGLGRLYRATRVSTGGLVAIKELRDVSSASPALYRARRELGALLKLKGHPYVVSVEEIIDGPNGPCIVMEYAPGGSLNDRVTRGPLSAPEVVLVGQHVSQALSAAHEEGIIHRDVKPHNLLVGTFGQVKVCDFGIAALLRGPSGRTQTQAITLAYASPEELDGEGDVGPAADAYSFAATMVHLITGRRPSFRDRLAGSRLELSLPIGELDPALRRVAGALQFGLAHEPDSRPQMDEFVAVFDEAASQLGPRKLLRLSPVPQLLITDVPPAVNPVVPSPEATDEAGTDRRPDQPILAAPVFAAPLISTAGDPANRAEPVGIPESPLQPHEELHSGGAEDDSLTVVKTRRSFVPGASVVGSDASADKPNRKKLLLVGAPLACVVAGAAIWIGVASGSAPHLASTDTSSITTATTVLATTSTFEVTTTTATATTAADQPTTTPPTATQAPAVNQIVPPITPKPRATTPTVASAALPTPSTNPAAPIATQPPPTVTTAASSKVYPVGDVNHDCIVDQKDIDIVQSDIGTANARSDLNNDRIVDLTDLNIANSHRGQTC